MLGLIYKWKEKMSKKQSMQWKKDGEKGTNEVKGKYLYFYYC